MTQGQVRQFTVKYTWSRMGRSGAMVICVGCRWEFEVYWWSLAGSGKRCPNCKLMYMSHGLVFDDMKAKMQRKS